MCVARTARRHLAGDRHVAPMTEHVGDNPAAVFRAMVPRWALRGCPQSPSNAVNNSPRTLRMRPKNPESTRRLSFRIPAGTACLHDAVPLRPDRRAARDRAPLPCGKRFADVLPQPRSRGARSPRATGERRVEVDRVVSFAPSRSVVTAGYRTASQAPSLRRRGRRGLSGMRRVPSGIGTPPCCRMRRSSHEVLVEAHASRDAVHGVPMLFPDMEGCGASLRRLWRLCKPRPPPLTAPGVATATVALTLAPRRHRSRGADQREADQHRKTRHVAAEMSCIDRRARAPSPGYAVRNDTIPSRGPARVCRTTRPPLAGSPCTRRQARCRRRSRTVSPPRVPRLAGSIDEATRR